MNKQKSLSKRFNPFLKKIVKQRTWLLTSRKGLKDSAYMRLLTDKFRRYEGTNFTDLGAAKFILRYKNELRAIIIERNASQIAEFESLVIAAKMYNQKKLAL